MRRRLTTYRSYLVPVLLSVLMGVSTATAACVVVIQVQCQPSCGTGSQRGLGVLGPAGAQPSDPVPSDTPSSSAKDLSAQPSSSESPGTNYSASGQQTASPEPTPSDPGPVSNDPAAGAVLASLDAIRQQTASCPDPLVVDQLLQSMAATQAKALEQAPPDRLSDRIDSAVDRARAVGFGGRVVEIVARGADTTSDLTAALRVGRYGRMALDCSLTAAGVGVGNGVVVIELGAAT